MVLPSSHNNNKQYHCPYNLIYLIENKLNTPCGNAVGWGLRGTAGDQTPAAYYFRAALTVKVNQKKSEFSIFFG